MKGTSFLMSCLIWVSGVESLDTQSRMFSSSSSSLNEKHDIADGARALKSEELKVQRRRLDELSVAFPSFTISIGPTMTPLSSAQQNEVKSVIQSLVLNELSQQAVLDIQSVTVGPISSMFHTPSIPIDEWRTKMSKTEFIFDEGIITSNTANVLKPVQIAESISNALDQHLKSEIRANISSLQYTTMVNFYMDIPITKSPTASPSLKITSAGVPTRQPTPFPTKSPTSSPTSFPSKSPVIPPTVLVTSSPTNNDDETDVPTNKFSPVPVDDDDYYKVEDDDDGDIASTNRSQRLIVPTTAGAASGLFIIALLIIMRKRKRRNGSYCGSPAGFDDGDSTISPRSAFAQNDYQESYDISSLRKIDEFVFPMCPRNSEQILFDLEQNSPSGDSFKGKYAPVKISRLGASPKEVDDATNSVSTGTISGESFENKAMGMSPVRKGVMNSSSGGSVATEVYEDDNVDTRRSCLVPTPFCVSEYFDPIDEDAVEEPILNRPEPLNRNEESSISRGGFTVDSNWNPDDVEADFDPPQFQPYYEPDTNSDTQEI